MRMLPPQVVLTPPRPPHLRRRLAVATLAALVPLLALVPAAGAARAAEDPVPPGAVQGSVGGGRLAEPGVVTALPREVPPRPRWARSPTWSPTPAPVRCWRPRMPTPACAPPAPSRR
ncbi:MAG: hypothetical protein M3P96_05910 [Actinomycetota bacterium]|nr:hypothetical protein [Actinomycetota bacterium]